MLVTRNGPHRSTKPSPPAAEYPPEIHTPQRPTVVNPMYTRPTIELPPAYLSGGPLIASDGVQFSRFGFPGINHTQIPAISYVRDDCWSPRIREVRQSSPPRQRCVSYSAKDSSARIEPESILRQPGLSRQPSTRSRHGSTVSLAQEERVPAARTFRTGAECLHQEE